MQWISLILALLILLSLHLQQRTHNDPAVVSQYHARVRGAAQAVPYRLGDWMGIDEPVPTAAVQLLRPNVMLGRGFFDADGRWIAALNLVQCSDTRDMAGHFPPVCYPAHGWQWSAAAEQVLIPLPTTDVLMTRYAFERSSFTAQRSAVIYGMFVLPTRGLAVDMGEVREAAADYRARGLGAAQVQVVLPSGLARDEEIRIAGRLIDSVWPVVEAVLTITEGEPER